MKHIRVPVKLVGKHEWGCLSLLASTHEIVGEKVRPLNETYTFADGHRVRAYQFKKNVHFKVPAGTEYDVSAIPPGQAPRRQQRR
jgi:hypothetical protein